MDEGSYQIGWNEGFDAGMTYFNEDIYDALEPFAMAAKQAYPDAKDDELMHHIRFTAGQLRAALKAWSNK